MGVGSRGVRITSGQWRGLRLQTSEGSRPTTERLREALFSRWGDRVQGSEFLDLFCGGGIVGCEAASRGAVPWFVDVDPLALSRVRGNAEHLGFTPRVSHFDLIDHPERRRGSQRGSSLKDSVGGVCFDLVFADPPYDLADYESVWAHAGEVLHERGEIALEVDRRRADEVASSLQCYGRAAGASPARNLELRDRRRYGDNEVLFACWSERSVL